MGKFERIQVTMHMRAALFAAVLCSAKVGVLAIVHAFLAVGVNDKA